MHNVTQEISGRDKKIQVACHAIQLSKAQDSLSILHT